MTPVFSLRFLLTLKATLIGIAVGVILGLFAPAFSQDFGVLGELYLALLKMCALPILVTAVVTSFAYALKAGEVGSVLAKTFSAFLFCMICAGIFGVIAGSLTGPWLMGNEVVRAVLSKLIRDVPQAAEGATVAFNWRHFFTMLIPDNVFRVLAEGQLLPLLFFIILFGVALGFEKSKHSEKVVDVLEGVRLTLFRIMSWFFYFLPVGLAAMVAKSISSTGSETIRALIWVVSTGIAVSLAYSAFSFTALCALLKRNPFQVARFVREPLLLAFGTSSSLAALPSSLKIMATDLRRDPISTNLVLPLGITFNGQGTVLFHAWITLLIGNVYGSSFSFSQILFILFACILRAVSAAGIPATATLMSIAIIFRPLGLPVETVVALLTVIFPLLDPFLTVNNVLGNLVVGSWATNRVARATV